MVRVHRENDPWFRQKQKLVRIEELRLFLTKKSWYFAIHIRINFTNIQSSLEDTVMFPQAKFNRQLAPFKVRITNGVQDKLLG